MNPSISEAASDSTGLSRPADFSLVEGGLFFKLLRSAHLTDEAMGHLRRRIVVIVMVAWLPLLVLSALEGHLLGGSVIVPFLVDIETHVRFLVALPLLLVAEVETFKRAPPIFRQFIDRRLVPATSFTRFGTIVASTLRLRNSAFAETLLLVVVYAIGILVWRQYLALDAATWYVTTSADGSSLTPAGTWYAFVSIPIAQFIWLRWYYRLFLWARFLWKTSSIELRLPPLHPDRAGGLGFLASVGYAFTMFAVAHGAIVAGYIASRIFFAGATLPDFSDEIALVVIFMLVVIFGPLLVFAPQLAAAKQSGLAKYGRLAERYVSEFDAKWLEAGAPADEALVGSADIQSLADLSNSYEVVRTMRIVPVTTQAITRLAAATLIPIVPLLLTMIPLSELLKRLFGIVF